MREPRGTLRESSMKGTERVSPRELYERTERNSQREVYEGNREGLSERAL